MVSTLISETIITSKRRRSCNSRCYGAKHPKCVCICHSVNHGVGLAQAQTNTQNRVEEIVRQGLQIGSWQLSFKGFESDKHRNDGKCSHAAVLYGTTT